MPSVNTNYADWLKIQRLQQLVKIDPFHNPYTMEWTFLREFLLDLVLILCTWKKIDGFVWKSIRKYGKIPLTTKWIAWNKLFTSNPNVTAIIDIKTAKIVSSFRNPNLSTIKNVNASTIVIVVPSHNGTLFMGNWVCQRIEDVNVI